MESQEHSQSKLTPAQRARMERNKKRAEQLRKSRITKRSHEKDKERSEGLYIYINICRLVVHENNEIELNVNTLHEQDNNKCSSIFFSLIRFLVEMCNPHFNLVSYIF